MEKQEFSIRDIKVYERIKAESGFTAQIKTAIGEPSKQTLLTIATDDEKIILDEYISLAVNECVVAISHYLSPCHITEESDTNEITYKIRHFNLTIPDNYPEENISALENIVMDFICNRVLQQWYMLVKADDANTLAAKTQSCMMLLRNILSMRKKPQ